ncbi:hypothetical protein [Streptomyces sp. TRM49041]|uniref:hypothetical protein n=1 Tax=Streptomyces sp. TRM49041 TaxID=2603216 RepID=UPI0011ECECBF|nr:hypothetical protein [Streptomyces sp. TRM49041]
MAPLLDSLGQKLAEKWLSALAAPGLAFVAAVTTGAVLGQGAALDRSLLFERVGHWAAEAARWPAVGQLALAGAVIIASVAVGTFVRTCAEGAERVWTGDWPSKARRLADRLTARRLRRWEQIQSRIDEHRRAAPAHQRGEQVRNELDELAARRDGIALAGPRRPTFTGDRMAATETRLRHQYGIDLASCWTRLWLVLPDDVRTELRASRARFGAAVAGSVWAGCYAVLGCFWWPAALVALVVGLVAWRRGRQAGTVHAELVESTVDIYLRRLADELGLDTPDGPPDLRVGAAVNRVARKSA